MTENEKRLQERVNRLTEALEKLSLGWLYYPAKRQPDPRVTMYESRTIDEIESMAKAALHEPCPKCGKSKAGKGLTYATETEPEKKYYFCANVKSGCYAGW